MTARPTVARSARAQPKRVRARARRRIRVGRRGASTDTIPSLTTVTAGFAAAPGTWGGLLLLGDDRLDGGDGAVAELDLDHEGADFAQRLLEPHLAFVDPQVAGL